MKNIHVVNFLIFAGLACLKTLAGWDIPDLVVFAPLMVMGLYSLAALYLDGLNFYRAMRQSRMEAKARKTTEAEVDLEVAKSKRRLERQTEQRARRLAKKGTKQPEDAGQVKP